MMGRRASHGGPVPSVPAIVLGGGVTALGVTRSLARGQISVYNVSTKHDFAAASRWWRPLRAVAETCHPTSAQLAAWLEPSSLERAVLFPCSDAWLQAVAGLPIRLARRFTSTVTFPRLDLLTDKACFAAAVQASRIPHPRTVVVQRRDDLERLSEAELHGTFLKPRHSQRFASRFGVKGFEVSSRDAALDQFGRAEAAGLSLVLQEWIAGPPSAHCFVDGFVDRRGQIRGLFGRRRVRMHPPRLGNSTCTESVGLSELAPIVAATERLIRHIRYRGIFSAEFKFDARDGQWKIIEMNPRPWWYVGFAASCGVDVCTMAYRDALGLPIDTVERYRTKLRCTYLSEDLRSCRQLHAAGDISLGEWIGSWTGSQFLELAWDDPLPGLKSLADTLLNVVRRDSPLGDVGTTARVESLGPGREAVPWS